MTPQLPDPVNLSWRSTSPEPVKRKGRRWLLVLAILFVVGAGWFLWARPHQWTFRRELPWSATEIRESYWTEGFLPDYNYYLKARITEKQFQDYLAKFELTPHTPERKYEDEEMWMEWGYHSNSWWAPSESLEKTFVWQGGHTWTFAKYENGNLYLTSITH